MPKVFGTTDEATSLFSVLKLTPGMSWKVNDDLSLGAAVGLNYTAGAQTLLPNTSALPSAQFPQGFFGVNFKDASGYGPNAKMGMQYRPMEDVIVALTYGTKAGTSRLRVVTSR